MSQKKEIRKEKLMLRESISIGEAEERSKKIAEKLKQDKDYLKAKTIMFYISKDKEVQTHDLIKEAMKNKKVIVPKVSNNGLLCCEIADFSKMKFSCYGVLEPTEEILCNPSNIDLIIVPGIAFDKTGHRIGYGKGYYDELLKKAKCTKIALAYQFQIIPKVPADEWDVRVDKVITE
jgi:5-formyltetrahydrofolate cyclo-ligase